MDHSAFCNGQAPLQTVVFARPLFMRMLPNCPSCGMTISQVLILVQHCHTISSGTCWQQHGALPQNISHRDGAVSSSQQACPCSAVLKSQYSWCAGSLQLGGPGVQRHQQGGAAFAALPQNGVDRIGANVASGLQACPCSCVLSRPVVRSIAQMVGLEGATLPARRGAAALLHNRIHRAGADIPSGPAGMPMLICPERTCGAQRLVQAGVTGRAASQQGGALLLCPTTEPTGMVQTCPLASGHTHAPVS